MGLMDTIRGLFSNSKDTQEVQPQINESYEKSRLAASIVSLVGEIQKINSFDSSIWNLATVTKYSLERRSLNELQKINNDLKNRLSELSVQKTSRSKYDEELEAAKWTGQKPRNMSSYEFDRFQRDDDR